MKCRFCSNLQDFTDVFVTITRHNSPSGHFCGGSDASKCHEKQTIASVTTVIVHAAADDDDEMMMMIMRSSVRSD